MILVEEIKLRTDLNKKTDARQYLMDTTDGIKSKNGLIEANIYDPAYLENDFFIEYPVPFKQ
jgi:hypothetical protein